MRRSWGAISMAPAMSRLKTDATVVESMAYAVLICSVRSPRAVSVDLPGLAPICTSGNSECVSAASDILFATIRSSTFPIVLGRAIGL